jgi:hypothetical protein
MIERFLPGIPTEDMRSMRELEYLIIGGEPHLRWPAMAALAWLPWRLSRMDLLPLPLVFFLFVAAMMLAGGHVTARYTLIFLPVLAVAMATVMLSLMPRLWLAVPAVVLVSLASSGPIKSAADLSLSGKQPFVDQIEALSDVGQRLQPGEMLVVCIVSGERRIVPALASYYAANGQPFVRLASERSLERHADQGALDGPLLGICKPEDLAIFADAFVNLQVIGERNGYTIWTASRGQ